MNMIPTTLSDVLKSLAQSFRVSSSFPATVLALLNCLLVLPQYTSIDFGAASTLALLLTAILVVSYLLYAFNAPLIRLAEGYPFRDEWLGQVLAERQQERYSHHRNELEMSQRMVDEIIIRQAHLVSQYDLVDQKAKKRHPEYRKLETWKQKWLTRWASARQALYYHYPYPQESEADLIPTLLGNTIASFERYPYDRYGIDAVAVWPRIVPILAKENFTPFVENEKTVFDFLLNMTFVALIVSVESACLVSLHRPSLGILMAVSFGIAAFVFYKAAVIGALNWGATIEVAFDLYRGHLRKALNMKAPVSLEQEQDHWGQLSEFYVDGIRFEHFVYEKENTPPDRYRKSRGCLLEFVRKLKETHNPTDH